MTSLFRVLLLFLLLLLRSVLLLMLLLWLMLLLLLLLLSSLFVASALVGGDGGGWNDIFVPWKPLPQAQPLYQRRGSITTAPDMLHHGEFIHYCSGYVSRPSWINRQC